MAAAIDYVKRYAKIIERIVGLRRARDASEAEMLCAILDIGTDADDMHALALAGCDSLERFCRRNELCEAARFRAFANGVKKVGRAKALEIGAEATIQAAKLTDTPAAVLRYMESLVAWREQHGGVAPSQQTARRIRLQVDPIPEVPNAVRIKTALAAERDRVAILEVENAQLRAQVAKLTKERDVLKARVTQLSKALPLPRGKKMQAARPS